MYRFRLLVSLSFLFMSSNANGRGGWEKLNECGKPVCFKGMNDSPGEFRSKHAGFVAAVKLVHRSGEIRCAPDAKYNSFFGCYNHHGQTKYPLNIAVTNADKKIKFPTSGIIPQPGANPAFWYALDGVNSRSKEIVLQRSFCDPYYVNEGQVLKVWYGEDLLNTWEGDNPGQVCVDVYGYMEGINTERRGY